MLESLQSGALTMQALSGAGWETTGSQSVHTRQLIDRNFHGLSSYGLMTVISSPTKTVSDASFQVTRGSDATPERWRVPEPLIE